MPTTWKRNYKTHEVMNDIQSCMGSGEVVLAIHAGNEEYLWRKMHPMCEDTGYSCNVMKKYIPSAEIDRAIGSGTKFMTNTTLKSMLLLTVQSCINTMLIMRMLSITRSLDSRYGKGMMLAMYMTQH